MSPSQAVSDKAQRLVAENRVILMPIQNTEWWKPQDEAYVAGQTRAYRVIADVDGVRCGCPAWRLNRPCSHQLAAMAVWADVRESATVRGMEPARRGGAAPSRVAGARGVRVPTSPAPRAHNHPTTGDAADAR